MLYLSTVDASALELLRKFMRIEAFSGLRLVGGTSLALQIGHRKSIDLDFFGEVDFENINTAKAFADYHTVKILQKSKNINVFTIDGVKVDFVNYNYPWLQNIKEIDGIRIAGTKDIAAMKLAAITGRGRKKDFVDIYFLLKMFTLEEIISFYNEKYHDASTFLALKSLLYFEDADQDVDPEMLITVLWTDIKNHIKNEVKQYFQDNPN